MSSQCWSIFDERLKIEDQDQKVVVLYMDGVMGERRRRRNSFLEVPKERHQRDACLH